ncbi:MAG TPA: NAD-dependent epimerase/dehydratase family protein [Solirubrobacteraceae bacterium]
MTDFEPYRGSRVLITGGLGFIGSHLATRLVDLGAEVTIVDSLIPEYGGNLHNVQAIADRVRINLSDIRDPWSIRALVRNQDFIFNLAGQVSHLDSMEDPETDLDINCKAQLSLLEACRRINPEVRVVFAASRQQYGRPQFVPVTEDHPLVPVDVNGINLIAGESYHLLYQSVYGIPAASLRLTNTYGPHLLMKHGRQGFITVFIRRALEGQDLQVFGDGAQLRDFIYVTDAVEAFLTTALTPEAFGRALNVGGLDPVSLLDVAELCQEIAGEGGTVHKVPWPPEREKIDIGSIYVDDTRLRELTDWSPSVGLREGLEATFAFYREHGVHYWT